MTTNEKRRAMTYLAGRILSYKEYDKMGYKETARKEYAHAQGAVSLLALALEDDNVFNVCARMKAEILAKGITEERINFYADRLE